MVNERFQAVYERLKRILEPYAEHLVVAVGDAGYTLNTPYVPHLQKEMFFASAQIRKNYVSFYLMPVYVFPALLDGISPELKKRMQGKSCFNFKKMDEPLLEELNRLIDAGAELYKEQGRLSQPR